MKEVKLRQYAEKYFDPVEGLDENSTLWETEASDFSLPKRKPVSHKYTYGRALVIAGSRGFSGAPVLAANACERSGAGLTHLMVPDSIYTVAAIKCDGAVVTGLPATVQGGIDKEALTTILPHLEKASACCIGPGLGLGEETKAVVKSVLRHAACPLVLDADALTLCAQESGSLSECRAPLILTPHEGEFRRIGGDLTDGRLAGALRFTKEHQNIILVLKGYGTLICRNRDITVNPTGNPGMAKGGSGDVLCGILCGLLAQGFEPLYAAKCAVFLHGLAGDLAALKIGVYSIAPSDLIRFLPKAFRML